MTNEEKLLRVMALTCGAQVTKIRKVFNCAINQSPWYVTIPSQKQELREIYAGKVRRRKKRSSRGGSWIVCESLPSRKIRHGRIGRMSAIWFVPQYSVKRFKTKAKMIAFLIEAMTSEDVT